MDFDHNLQKWHNKPASSDRPMNFHHWYRAKPKPNKTSLFIGLCVGFCIGLLLSNVIA